MISFEAFLTILGMGVVTYITRVSGYWLTSWYTPTGRVLAAMEILPGAVLMSIVAPVVFATGIAESIAALATVGVTVKTGRFFMGVCVGIVTIFVLRNFIL